MYGYGHAESCLGEFIQRHPSDTTVTTKYGIPPARNSTLLRMGRRVAGPVLEHLPALKRHLAKAANVAATHNQPRPAFTAVQAAASLERSLRALRTGRIDVWLLHEVTASDLEDDGLLRFLEDQVANGTIGGCGVGSSADKIAPLLAQRPAYCRILQYDWSVLDRPMPPSNSFRVHHRALTENFRTLHSALLKNNAICQRWSQAVDADLAQAPQLARLMLKAALVMNPDSIILFSSKRPEHIHANIETANNASLEASSQRLYRIAQDEREQLFAAPA
jgi:D-threo-aldose 1-dehydrogenase